MRFAKCIFAWKVACVLAIILFLVASAQHFTSINAMAHHDDAWFIAKAESIVKGEWLGPYNELTLIKGPVYSVFLAINHLAGTPLWLAQASLYLAACMVFTASLQNVVFSRGLRYALFVSLLLQPALFPTRIIRDNIYPSLLLLSLAGFLLTADTSIKKFKYLKIFLSGLALSFFWHTREENVWIVPCAVLLLSWSLASSLIVEKSAKHWSMRIAVLLGASLIPTIVFVVLNSSHYNTTDIVDFKGKAFQRSLNSLTSVTEDAGLRYLPVSSVKRELIYRYSPSFKELSQTLENPNNGWKLAGCAPYPHTCGDFAGGWFAWAIRSAAQVHGKYSSPETSDNFYLQISREISEACESGKLVCSKSLIPFLPRITQSDINRIPTSVATGIFLSLYQWKNPPAFSPSAGPSTRISEIQNFIHDSSGPPTFGKSIQFSSNHDTENQIKIVCSETVHRPYLAPQINTFNAKIQFFTMKDANRVVFSSFIPDEATCRLVTDKDQALIDTKSIRSGNAVHVGGHNISLKQFNSQPNNTKQKDVGIGIRLTLFSVYKYMTPMIVLVGIFSFFISGYLLLAKDAQVWLAIIPPLAFWTLYFTRIVILALIDVTSFPGMTPLYMIPAFPVLLISSILSFNTVIQLWPTRNNITVNK